MGARRPNPRLVKVHRSYTVEDAAATLGVHKNTVRHWIKAGLPVIDRKRPALILGRALRDFLLERRNRAKRPCRPGEIYCVKCRSPRRPAFDEADYVPLSPTSGNLRGLCPDCTTLIHRRVSLARIEEVRGNLKITFPQPQRHIGERTPPSPDCDSGKEREAHENA